MAEAIGVGAAEKAAVVRHGVVSVAWLLLLALGPRALFLLLPRALFAPFSPTLIEIVLQIVTTGLGLVLVWFVGRDVVRILGATRPQPLVLAKTALAAPLVHVISSWAALKIAEDMLVREYEQRGSGTSQQNAGAMAQQLLQAPAILVFLWAVLLAAVVEELLFRGVIWGAIERAIKLFRKSSGEDLDHVAGTVATVGSALIFSAMHLMGGVVGGVLVLRLVSTLLLGLACGLVRQMSRYVWPAVLLHLVNNLLSLPTIRRAAISESLPVLGGVPSAYVVFSVVGAIGFFVWFMIDKKRRQDAAMAAIAFDEPSK